MEVFRANQTDGQPRPRFSPEYDEEKCSRMVSWLANTKGFEGNHRYVN